MELEFLRYMKLSTFISEGANKIKSESKCIGPCHTYMKQDVGLHTFMSSKELKAQCRTHRRLGSKMINFCFGNDVKAKHLFSPVLRKTKEQSLDTVHKGRPSLKAEKKRVNSIEDTYMKKNQ